jgi:Zn-dependent protease with chaperone function
MTSEPRFDGLYYAGREKFVVQFAVSRHGVIEFTVEGLYRQEIVLPGIAWELIGDPKTTLQMSWVDGEVRHALLCSDSALIDKLLTLSLPQPVLQQVLALQQQQRQSVKGEKHRVPVYLGLIAAFFIGGYLALHFSAPLFADMIPYEWERKIGAMAFEHYQLGKKTVGDKAVNDAVDSIVKRIDQFDEAEIVYEVAVVDADMINAFAFPGGYVVVTTGLIANSDNPEQVAGVLAHELTHVLERHGMRKLVRQAGLGVLIGIVFGDVSALSQLIELSSQLDSLSFDRSQEQRADDGAIKIMIAAGLSPQNLAAFFEKIQQADAISGNIPELFQTHPLTDERIKRVSAAAEPQQVFTFDIDWDKVKQNLAHR